jgi:tetratricopeptide (TPR) repeat protein
VLGAGRDAVTSTAPRTAADTERDAIAALEEERDFLLRSLDDLEREHDAGDVDDTDYVTLRDDYTARAAVVIRAIEAKQTASEPARPRRQWGRTLGWVAAIIVFAVLAGVLVARMSGTRRDSESATGDVRENTRQLLIDAMSAAQRNELDDALTLYDEALALSPSDAEGLAYRGWTRFKKGDDDAAALSDVEAAIASDPTFPDARVFRTIMLAEAGDFTAAAEELEAFDALDPPPLMLSIVDQYALRERIIASVLLADGAPSYADAGYTTEQVVATARYLATSAPVQSLGLYDQVLAADPQNVAALADRGYLLGRAAESAEDETDLGARAIADLDAALAIDPQHPAALAYRALTRYYVFDDAAGAKQDLDAFDALSDKPSDVVSLVDRSPLREDIEAALAG